jgi:hypothetical protein
MAAILLHSRNPLTIVEQCAKRAKTLVITELLRPDIEGLPVCRLMPTKDNNSWHTWWNFSTDFLKQFVGVLGFDDCRVTKHMQSAFGHQLEMFTVVARTPATPK